MWSERRSIYFAATESRSLGGFQLYIRNIIRALEPRKVEVVEYTTLPVFEDYSANAVVSYSSGRRSCFAAKFALDYLTRPPTVFIVGHIGLLRALTAVPRQSRHRVVLLIAGREGWHRFPQHLGLALGKVDSVEFIAGYNRDVFMAANGHYLRQDSVTRTIWLACNPEIEQARPAPTPTGSVRRCLYVSRLVRNEPLKGLSTLLRASKHLDPNRWMIDVVGTGSGLEAYRNEAAKLGVNDRVRFSGKVTNEGREERLVASDVLCLPSAQEGFGIVFMEAMIKGRPCVGAAATAIPEVLPPSVGELAPYGDDVALGHALERASERLRSGDITPESIRAVYDERYGFNKFRTRWCDYVDELRYVPTPNASGTSTSLAS